jgi:hypothetical protein
VPHGRQDSSGSRGPPGARTDAAAHCIIDQLLDVYDRLPEDIRASIPLKRAWVLLEETG